MLQLNVIGESHADGLIGAVVSDATGPVAAVHVTHVPALAPSEFLDSNGAIGTKIVIAMAAARFLHYATADDPSAIGHHHMASNVFSPPWAPHWRRNAGSGGVPLLFVSGEIAARYVSGAIPLDADIIVPFAADALVNVPTFAARAAVSTASVEAAVEKQLAPMFRALRLLRSLGFGPLGLHSVDPTTSDDELYQSQCGYATRALTRTKVVMLVNSALQRFCAAEGFFFIDRWADFTEGGLVRPGILLDAVHARGAAMRVSAAHYYHAVAATST